MGSHRNSERISFVVVHIEQRSSIALAEKIISYPITQSFMDVTQDLEIAQENKCMTIWMLTRTNLSDSWDACIRETDVPKYQELKCLKIFCVNLAEERRNSV